MKEGIVSKGPRVEIIESPLPLPTNNQIVIKVVYSGSNPKDWKVPEWTGKVLNAGDDISGYVHEVGAHVTEFKKGDRVAAFHEMMTPHGSFAEYALAWAYTTFHLPKNTSFEQGATIPLAAMTAAIGLFHRLPGLPPPIRPGTDESVIPLVVYGGASAVGAYAIQFARRSNIHPIIAVAGNGIPFVKSLLDQSKGDVVVDYRKGDEAVVQGILNALRGRELGYAFDAVSEKGSYINLTKVLQRPGGNITLVLPGKEYEEIPKDITKTITSVGAAHDSAKDFAYVYFRLIAKGLQDGWFKAHPYEVIPGGIGGVQRGLQNLKDGKASATKYIFKIADTPGADKYSA